MYVVIIVAAVIVLELHCMGFVSVVWSVVPFKGSEPFMWHLVRAASWHV